LPFRIGFNPPKLAAADHWIDRVHQAMPSRRTGVPHGRPAVSANTQHWIAISNHQ
jgi:hypothetical protein